MFVLALNMLPTQPDSSLMVYEEILLFELIVNIDSLKSVISTNSCLNNMPNLVLLKGQ